MIWTIDCTKIMKVNTFKDVWSYRRHVAFDKLNLTCNCFQTELKLLLFKKVTISVIIILTLKALLFFYGNNFNTNQTI